MIIGQNHVAEIGRNILAFEKHYERMKFTWNKNQCAAPPVPH